MLFVCLSVRVTLRRAVTEVGILRK